MSFLALLFVGGVFIGAIVFGFIYFILWCLFSIGENGARLLKELSK